MSRIVICMKWGNIYSADYVNVLFNACRRNMSKPFRFLCLTDDPSGIDNAIEISPIPEIGCTAEMWTHGAWPKLAVFAHQIGDVSSGRALFIDLDTVISGNIDAFFDHPSSFVGIDTGDNWRPGRQTGGRTALLGTGVFAFDVGTQTQILEKFQEDPAKAFSESDIEQVWVQKNAHGINYWPEDWVVSFKRWLRRPIGLDLFLQPKKPPSHIGMVAFHGDPRPADLLRSDGKRWGRFPHQGRGQVEWMVDYWLSNGGHLPN